MSSKKNQPASALDVLCSYLENEVKSEIDTLSQMSLNVATILAKGEKAKTILSSYDFNLSKKPEFDAFVKQLKNATFARFSNLESLTEKVEKDVITGKDVTIKVRTKVPAIWCDDARASQIRSSGVKLVELIDPETGGRHEKTKIFHIPTREIQEITYKDADGKTQKKTIPVQTGYTEEKRLLHAYLKPVYKLHEIIDGLREMLFVLDLSTTKSAQLIREFENAAKDNKNKESK